MLNEVGIKNECGESALVFEQLIKYRSIKDPLKTKIFVTTHQEYEVPKNKDGRGDEHPPFHPCFSSFPPLNVSNYRFLTI